MVIARFYVWLAPPSWIVGIRVWELDNGSVVGFLKVKLGWASAWAALTVFLAVAFLTLSFGMVLIFYSSSFSRLISSAYSRKRASFGSWLILG